MNGTLFRLVQGSYWMGLGIWLGALVMLAVGAAVTFKTVRSYEPTITLAPYNDPQLADRAAPILAGAVVGNMLKALGVVQTICALVVVVCVVLQMTVLRGEIVSARANMLRLLLIAVPIVVLVVNTTVFEKRIWTHRSVMYDPQQPAAARETAKIAFDRYHKLSERLVGTSALMLGAAFFASSFAFHCTTGTSGHGTKNITQQTQ